MDNHWLYFYFYSVVFTGGGLLGKILNVGVNMKQIVDSHGVNIERKTLMILIICCCCSSSSSWSWINNVGPHFMVPENSILD